MHHLARVVVELVVQAPLQHLDVAANHAQRLAQVVGGNIRKLLQLGVGVLQLAGQFGEPALPGLAGGDVHASECHIGGIVQRDRQGMAQHDARFAGRGEQLQFDASARAFAGLLQQQAHGFVQGLRQPGAFVKHLALHVLAPAAQRGQALAVGFADPALCIEHDRDLVGLLEQACEQLRRDVPGGRGGARGRPGVRHGRHLQPCSYQETKRCFPNTNVRAAREDTCPQGADFGGRAARVPHVMDARAAR